MSLVELMVSVGILAIVMAGMSSYINSVHTETRSLTEMMAKLEVEKNVIGVFADDVVCTAELSNPALNPHAPYKINGTNANTIKATKFSLTKIHLTKDPGSPILIENGKEASLLTKSLIVSSITLEKFEQAVPNVFKAELVITFDSTKLIRALAPIRLQKIILTDSGDPKNAQKVTACGSSKPPTINFAKAFWTGKVCDPGPCRCPAGSVMLGTSGWWATYTNPNYLCAPVE
jgi:hypothetical protein